MTCLRDLWIDGFGCLRTRQQPVRFDADRVTLFLDDNEAGKTTLQMALVASLYGLETDRRRLNLERLVRPHQLHWQPLGGPPFGTRLRCHDGDRLLEIRWDFARGAECRVVDLDANREVTAELCPNGEGHALGEALLGLSIEEFIKTCLVCQDDLDRVRDAEGLNILVQRAATSMSSETTVGQALERLQALLRNYPGSTLKGGEGLIETEIRRLEEAVADTTAQLNRLREERQKVADEDAEYQRLAARRRTLREEVTHLEYLAQAAEHQELHEKIEQAKADQALLAELEAERERLAELEGFPLERADLLIQWDASRRSLLGLAEQKERALLDLERRELEPARHQLEDLGSLAHVTQDDVSRVHRLLVKAQDLQTREQEHRDTLAREEDRLAAQGASSEELDRLEERFADLAPEDAAFLDNTERLHAQAATEIERTEREALEARQRIERIEDSRQRLHEAARHTRVSAAVAAAAGLVLGAALLFATPVASVLAALAGLGAAAWLILRSQRQVAEAETAQADELALARRHVQDLEARREELGGEQQRRRNHLKGLARAFGYEQPEVLLDDFRSLEQLRKLSTSLVHLRAQAHGPQGLAEQRQALEADASELFAAYGLQPPRTAPLAEALEELQGKMDAALQLQRKVHSLAKSIESDHAEADKKRQDAEGLTGRIRTALTQAGIRQTEPIQDAIEEFQRRRQDCARLRQLTDDLIPQARQRVVAPGTLEAWEEDAERLHRAVATQREERPDLVTLQVDQRSQEYRRQLERRRAELEECTEEASRIGKHVLDVIDRARTQGPELETQVADLDAQLRRTRRHKTALELAADVLGQIGHQVHGQWAEELNRTTGQFLQRMAPRLQRFKFDPDLRFGVWPHGGEAPARSEERSPLLSAGTWDQLCLAVRLGLAEFISRRGSASLLLLDDPFAHFDDRRFEQAVRLLGELAADRHQVVLFSCQRQRFQWLQERDPEWFNAHVVRRSITALTNV